jgi:hypothetical protein
MKDIVRTIAKLYLTAGIWLFVLLAATPTLTGLMSPLYAAAGVDLEIRVAVTMAMAIVAASIAARLTWRFLGRAARSSRSGAESWPVEAERAAKPDLWSLGKMSRTGR